MFDQSNTSCRPDRGRRQVLLRDEILGDDDAMGGGAILPCDVVFVE